MKKIALLHFAYPPNIGGVEIILSEQANILSELGHDVLVLVGSGKEARGGIKLVEEPILQSLLRTNPDLQDKILQKGLTDNEFYDVAAEIEMILKTNLEDRDVIIVHNMLTIIRNMPFVYAFKKFIKDYPDKKIILWVHDQSYIDGEKILTEEPGVDLSQDLKELLLTPIPNAQYVFISETFKNLFRQLVKVSDGQVRVIPNGINIKQFLEIDDLIWSVYEKNEILRSFPIILSPINILPRKNIEFALEVLKELKVYYPTIKYLISGNTSQHRDTDTYFGEIMEKIKLLELGENIIFLKDHLVNSLEMSQIHDLYQLADLVFYFSRSENFGLPIIESILAKTMFFASNLKVFREIVPEDVFFNTQGQNPVDTAQKIKAYLDQNPQIEITNRARVSYDMESIIKEKLVPLL